MTGEFVVAVHALVYLNVKCGEDYGEGTAALSSETLAKNICTNPARVRKVMASLKKAGLVGTKEGVDGGYYLTGSPKAMTLGDICEALDMQVVSAPWRSGSQELDCPVGAGMAGELDLVYEDLDRTCREKLDRITVDALSRKLQSANKKKDSEVWLL